MHVELVYEGFGGYEDVNMDAILKTAFLYKFKFYGTFYVC